LRRTYGGDRQQQRKCSKKFHFILYGTTIVS
jgi:hypothetical protein